MPLTFSLCSRSKLQNDGVCGRQQSPGPVLVERHAVHGWHQVLLYLIHLLDGGLTLILRLVLTKQASNA